jgi:hypothetical protein
MGYPGDLMTVAAAGLWELGHNVPLSEAPLWEMVIRDFGVEEWHMSPVTGIANQRVTEWVEVEAMLAHQRKQRTIVFITEDGQFDLAELNHPLDVCYVTGRCNFSPFLNLVCPGDLSVRISTANNKALLWPHQCLAIALWHRRSQWP